MDTHTLNDALSHAGVPEDRITNDRRIARDLVAHIVPILRRLKLLQSDSASGLFISGYKFGETPGFATATWIMSDGKNLLLIKPKLNYADLDIEVYRVAALSLKSVTAAKSGAEHDRRYDESSLSYRFATGNGREDLQLVANGMNCTALESFVTTYLMIQA